MQPKWQEIDEQILRIVERGPATPDEVATELGVAWATAHGHLLKLVGEGKLTAVRKGKVNIFLLRYPAKVNPRTPPWAKVKDLEALSKELESFFPSDVSAAEMVERERRRS